MSVKNHPVQLAQIPWALDIRSCWAPRLPGHERWEGCTFQQSAFQQGSIWDPKSSSKCGLAFWCSCKPLGMCSWAGHWLPQHAKLKGRRGDAIWGCKWVTGKPWEWGGNISVILKCHRLANATHRGRMRAIEGGRHCESASSCGLWSTSILMPLTNSPCRNTESWMLC